MQITLFYVSRKYTVVAREILLYDIIYKISACVVSLTSKSACAKSEGEKKKETQKLEIQANVLRNRENFMRRLNKEYDIVKDLNMPERKKYQLSVCDMSLFLPRSWPTTIL